MCENAGKEGCDDAEYDEILRSDTCEKCQTSYDQQSAWPGGGKALVKRQKDPPPYWQHTWDKLVEELNKDGNISGVKRVSDAGKNSNAP